MNRRTLVCLTFLALFLFSTLSLITSMMGTIPNIEVSGNDNVNTDFASSPLMPPIPEGPIWDGTEYLYEGLGQVLATQEFSSGTTGTLSVSDLDFGETSSGQIQLPQGWTGYELTANVFNLFDNISHIEGNTRNGNFESGTTSPTYWVESKRGMSGSGLVGINWFYGTQWGETGDGVAVVANCSGYNWIANETYIEYVGWTQTIDLNRIDATSATLSFDVQFYDDNVHGRDDDDEMAVYVEVGGAIRVFVCHRYALNAYRGGWGFHPIEFSLSTDELNAWASDTINVTIGMTVDFDWTINNYFFMDFDNVQLIVRGKPSPTSNGIQLRLNSTSSWTDTNYGLGTISISGTWGPYAADHNIAAIWSTAAALSRNVDFDYTLTLRIQRSGQTESQTGPEGSAFFVKHGESVYWTAWFFAPFYTIFFENYNFTLQKPTSETWTLFKAIDPNLQDQTAGVNAASNSTHFRLPASVVTGFGWWNFTFSSTNRITSISGLAASYNIGDTLSVTINHNTVTSGQCNITIYDSDHQIVHEEAKSLTGTTQVSFSKLFDDGDTFPAGLYTICATYDNGATGSMTRAGFSSSQFKIIHTTQLDIENGATQKTVTYGTGTFFIRLTYDDLDKSVNPWVTNTTGTVQINGTVDTNFIVFRQYGNLYQAEIDNDLMLPGNHLFMVTADDPFHDSASDSIWLLVRSDATLTSPESPGLTVPYDESFTIQVFYEDNLSIGISDATVTTDWPTNPTGIGNGTAGWYDITIDSGDQPSPGTYSLKISASKTNYLTQALTLTIVVREISTSISYFTPGSVPYGENIIIPFNYTVNDPDSHYDGNGVGSVQKSNLTLTLDGSTLSSGDFTFSPGAQTGMYSITILYSSMKINAIKNYNLQLKVAAPGIEYADSTTAIGFSVRQLRTSLTYDAPAAEPWGNDMIILFYYTVDDPISGSHTDPITTIGTGEVSCELNGSAVGSFGWVHLGSGQYQLTINAADITQVIKFRLYITLDDSGDVYDSAERTLHFVIRAHQTQAIVDPPAETVLGQDTPITVVWVDLDAGGNIDGNLTNIVVSGCPVGGDQTFGSLIFTLDTDSWPVGTHVLTLTVNPATIPGWYLGDSATVNVVIRIHYTGVTVQPPNPTPWGKDTAITVVWTDLDIGGNVPGIELLQVVVADGPGADQIFSSLSFTLDTSGWAINVVGYTLNVTVYARTSPSHSYSDAWGSVTVVIRIHRVEVVVSAPPPTAWSLSTPLTVTWNDLDTGTTIAPSSLDNITVSNCPVGGDQTFSTLSFTLITDTWVVDTYLLNVTVYPNMITQEYEIASYQVSVTIRPHYVSVTIDPPAQTPWGFDTSLSITWRDVDLNIVILEANLDHVNITGGPGGTQTFTTLTPTLVTNGWSVGGYSLTVWVYGNINYVPNSGPVTVTIRGHQTQTIVTPPQQTPFGFDTNIDVSWVDLDLGSIDVPGGNLLSIVVSGGPGDDQTFGSLSFTLITNTWSVSTYTLTVIVTPSNTNYLSSSSNTTIIIRIHYTSVTVQTPEPTPWGMDTPLAVTWTDLDMGTTISETNLDQIVISNSPGPDQTFFSLSFNLDTDTWALSSGYTITVTLYAETSPSQSYSHAVGTVTIAIRTHRVNVVVTGPAPVPEDGVIPISIEWTDIDTETPIGTGVLDYVEVSKISGGTTVGLPYINGTHLNFYIDATGWDLGPFRLNVTVYSSNPNYATGWGPVNIFIRIHSITADVDPIPRVPVGNNVTILLRVNDSDLADILPEHHIAIVEVLGGPSTLTFDSSNWYIWVINGSTIGETGIYYITLDTTTWTVDTTYALTINVVTTPDYGDGVIFTSLIIRKVTTAFSRDPPDLIPWNEPGNVTFHYFIEDPDSDGDGNPLTSATITVLGLSGTLYNTYNLGFGEYIIEFLPGALGEPGLKSFTIEISQSINYQAKSLLIVVQVRPLKTSLTFDQIVTMPYGDPINIRVYYDVFDPESTASGKISGAVDTIYIIGLNGLNLVKDTNYTVVEFGTYYRIQITATLDIGSYQFEIYADHTSNRYESDSIIDPPVPFYIRTVYSEVDKPPVDAVPYSDVFTITIIYKVRDDLSSQDGDGIIDADDILITTNGSWTLNPGDWSISQGTAGYYYITIDSDLTPYPGAWWIQIDVGWLAANPPYEEQTVTAYLISIERPTKAINTNPPDTNYADIIEVYLNYTDLTTGWGIDNATTGNLVRIYLINATDDSYITTDYWIDNRTIGSGWEESIYFYRLNINASQLGEVNVVLSFIINVQWLAGESPYYAQANASFTVRTTGSLTILYADSVEQQPVGDDIEIVLHYETDPGGLGVPNSSENVGVIISCEDIPGWDDTYWFVNYTHPEYDHLNGVYVIIIDGSKSLDIDVYTFNITLTWPTGFDSAYAPFYTSANQLVSARVRQIQTTLDYYQPDVVYWNQTLTLIIEYRDYDHHVSIPLSLSDISAPPLSILGLFDNGDGTYNITLNTIGLPAGTVEFDLLVNKLNYFPQARDIDIQLRYAPLDPVPVVVHATTSPDDFDTTIVVRVGEIINVTIHVSYEITGLDYNGLVEIWWASEPATSMHSNGEGYYWYEIDTSAIGAIGTQIFIHINEPNHEEAFLLYTLSILQVDTQLTIPEIYGWYNTTVFTEIVDSQISLYVNYSALHPVTSDPWYQITGADVYLYNGSSLMGQFLPVGGMPGTYQITFIAADWPIGPIQLTVSAYTSSTVQRSISFSITIGYKPCELVILDGSRIDMNYNDTRTITVQLIDPLLSVNIPGHNITVTWKEAVYTLISNGTPGFYYFNFTADDAPRDTAYTLPFTHGAFDKFGYKSSSTQIVIHARRTSLEIIRAETIATIDGETYYTSIPLGESSWRIPIGETIVFVIRFKDHTNITLTEAIGAAGGLSFFRDAEDFVFNSTDGYWYVSYHLQYDDYEGPFELTFTRQYFEPASLGVTLQATRIPIEIIPIIPQWEGLMPEVWDVYTTYSFEIFVNDIYHNTGVDALVEPNLDLKPAGCTITVTPDEQRVGYYIVTISTNTPSAGRLVITASRDLYETFELDYPMTLSFSPIQSILVTVGSIGVVVLIITLIGWILWARVYSIPWEVRRMRKLAKTVEKEDSYSLSKKDMKHFKERGIILEDKVDTAMSPIGVAVTPAMLPKIEEVEEVTATEEDIMGELDKIPGLGPEEKAVLAEEMRKIPRKDRIWFLDDLRRQMGQRRMDFLTTRERPPKPAPEAEAEPVPPKPTPVEAEAPPLEEVKPKEPPPSKALTEDRTAPTVLPPDLQLAPAAPAAVVAEIRRELSKIPGLSEEEKAALVDHLQYLSKEERQATYRSLKMSANEGK